MTRFGINCLLCDRVILLEGIEEQRALCGLRVLLKYVMNVEKYGKK